MGAMATLTAAAVYAAVVMRPFIAAGLRRRGLPRIAAASAAPGGSAAAPAR